MISDTTNTCREAVTDPFSLRRAAMVAAYWWPRLMREAIPFFAVSLALGLIAGWADLTIGHDLSYIVMSPIYYATVSGPAIFAMKAGRRMEIALPASNAEKMTFMLLYSLVVLPLITIYTTYSAYWLLTDSWPMTSQKIFDYSFPAILPEKLPTALITASQIISCVATGMITLYVAAMSRSNGVIKSIAIVFALNIGIGMLTGIIVGAGGMHTIMEAAEANYEAEMIRFISGVIGKAMWANVIGGSLLFIVFLTLFIRNFGRRQI